MMFLALYLMTVTAAVLLANRIIYNVTGEKIMNYKNKAIEIATNGASIAFGLAFFLAVLISIPIVFIGSYIVISGQSLLLTYNNSEVIIQSSDIWFYALMTINVFGLIWALIMLMLQLRTDYISKKKRQGGDS